MLDGFFLWLGVGMILGLLYAVIRYGVPVIIVGICVIACIMRDCTGAFVEGFRRGGYTEGTDRPGQSSI